MSATKLVQGFLCIIDLVYSERLRDFQARRCDFEPKQKSRIEKEIKSKHVDFDKKGI